MNKKNSQPSSPKRKPSKIDAGKSAFYKHKHHKSTVNFLLNENKDLNSNECKKQDPEQQKSNFHKRNSLMSFGNNSKLEKFQKECQEADKKQQIDQKIEKEKWLLNFINSLDDKLQNIKVNLDNTN